jgi:uncharacterized repeat protein (TIGR03943 family)
MGPDACECLGADDDHGDEHAPSRLRSADAAALLAALAGLVLWASLTDSIYRYVRPTMRPWLVLSGAAIVVLAVAVAVGAWREGRRPGAGAAGRYSLIGWALLVPALIALSSDPGALGSFAVQQAAGASFRADRSFDLDAYVQSHTTGGQAPSLSMGQFLSAVDDPDDRALLAETTVRLTGFVADDGGMLDTSPPGAFALARLMIGCCAGDAIPLLVDVQGIDGGPPPVDTWVEVTGRYRPADDGARDEGDLPVLVADDLRRVDEPRQPYEYP